MAFETSAVRLWRTLDREDRLAGARAFWNRPTEEGAALAAREIVKILRVRPQAFARVPLDQRVRAVAGLVLPQIELRERLVRPNLCAPSNDGPNASGASGRRP